MRISLCLKVLGAVGCVGLAMSGSAYAAAAGAVVSPGSLSFAETTVGSSAAAQIVTLTNPGTSKLMKVAVSVTGASAAMFSQTTTCGKTLTAGARCTITVSFTPTAAGVEMATLTVADSATGSPQTVALSGTSVAGGGGGTARTLVTFPDQGYGAIYALFNGAHKTIDMTMYELVDTIASADLVAACKRGVQVRVILDQNSEKASNTAAYNQLNAVTNCKAVWANPKYHVTHQKTITVDGTTSAILSANLTTRYYPTSRDFALIETDAADVAAIESTFAQDFVSATYTPTKGDDLIWSPTTAQTDLLGIINGATKTLLVENEEMGAPNIVSALEAACTRGVAVSITMTDGGTFDANLTALKAAGCGVRVYTSTTTGLYIHAKVLVADYGTAAQTGYLGSINFSLASMNYNRELGLYVSDPILGMLSATLTKDFDGAKAYAAK